MAKLDKINGKVINDCRIYDVANTFGSLYTYKCDGKYYWDIENRFAQDSLGNEIPKYLYDALIKFHEEELWQYVNEST